jgi:hypothetical protein
MQIPLLPALGIGALIFAALRQGTKKAIEKISVSFEGIVPGLPPKIKLNFFNPTALKVEVTFIKIVVFYKETEVATLSNFDTRVINPGSNKLTLELKPSLSALSLLNKPKGTARVIRVTWEIGTKLYSITGEKSTTL